MLYPFQAVSAQAVPLPPLDGDRPAPARFLELTEGLNRLFDEAPAVLRLQEGASLTLLYRDAAYRWQDIFECIGPQAAAVSSAAPLRFFGATRTRETAEFTVSAVGPGKGLARLRSVSGRPFGPLQGLGVRLELPRAEDAALLAEAAAALPRRTPCGVLPRGRADFLASWGLLLPAQGSLFSYLAWEAVSPRQALYSLTSSHKAALWRAFLLDGQQPLEFDWLWESYYTDEVLFLLEWELALRAVLEDLGFQVERGPASFRVLDGGGRERRFDFAQGGPAEKLFLKLLFPLDTK